MNRKNKVILITIIFLTLISLNIGIKAITNQKIVETDAILFRQEYMSYNAKVSSDNNEAYVDLLIEDDNMIKYLSPKEAVEMLQKGSGVIYFGYAANQDCRNFIPSLLNVSKKMQEVIYYLDISSIMPEYKVVDNNLTCVKESDDYYREIVTILNDYLDNSIVINDQNYTLEEKYLASPTIISLNQGKVTSFYSGVNTEEDILEATITSIIESKNNIEHNTKGC